MYVHGGVAFSPVDAQGREAGGPLRGVCGCVGLGGCVRRGTRSSGRLGGEVCVCVGVDWFISTCFPVPPV